MQDAVLFCSETLSILPATTPTGFRTPVHDHPMWAVIGVYEGEEPNDFFIDGEDGLQRKNWRVLRYRRMRKDRKAQVFRGAASSEVDKSSQALLESRLGTRVEPD